MDVFWGHLFWDYSNQESWKKTGSEDETQKRADEREGIEHKFQFICSLDKGFAESIFSWVAFIEGDRRVSQPPSENLRLPVF